MCAFASDSEGTGKILVTNYSSLTSFAGMNDQSMQSFASEHKLECGITLNITLVSNVKDGLYPQNWQ